VKSSLDSEGVKYNESSFNEIFDLLNSAESLAGRKDYISADEKIRLAENKLEEVKAYADRQKAESLRDELKKELDEAYTNLSYAEVMLNNVKGSENYTAYLKSYAELKSLFDSLKSSLSNAENLISSKNYKDAYNSLKSMQDDLKKLISGISDLQTKLEAEGKRGGFSLPVLQLPIQLPVSPLYLGIVAAVVIVAALAIKIRGGRRKWDELR